MVQKWDAQHRSSLRQPERQCLIFFTRRGDSAWMVVGDDRCRHAFPNQRAKDIGHTDDDAIDLPHCRNVTTANPVPRIKSEDVDGLLLGLT